MLSYLRVCVYFRHFSCCLGNAVVVKPSELSEHSARLMKELLPLYLDKVHELILFLLFGFMFVVSFLRTA